MYEYLDLLYSKTGTLTCEILESGNCHIAADRSSKARLSVPLISKNTFAYRLLEAEWQHLSQGRLCCRRRFRRSELLRILIQ